KWWGPENVRPILCLHGYQDNAGTWDTLIPLLPPEMSFLAIDLPGHGYSSHFPRGTPYHALDFVLTIRRIANIYGWDKISLLGHSYGSVISFIYSALYPEHVQYYIGVDSMKPLSIDPYKRLSKHAERLDQFLYLDSLDPENRPSYTYEGAVDHLHKSIKKWLSREGCEILSRRGTVKLADGSYSFSRDPRLKEFIDLGFSHSLAMAFAANIRCKILYIKANQGLEFEKPELRDEFFNAMVSTDRHPKIFKISIATLAVKVYMLRLVARTLHQHCGDVLRLQRMNTHNAATKALEREIREVQIPVPWGHIAGKWWGPENVRPLLCLHGYQDNAGTWDTLIPLLPPEMSFLAIDLPGHGYSSHFPKGIPYHASEFVLAIRQIANNYSWDKISFLCHSYGTVISIVYSALYPEHVQHLVGVDSMKPLSIDPDKMLSRQAERFNQFLQLDTLDPKSRPSYTYEGAVDLLYKSLKKWASREGCEILSKRGIVKLDDGSYTFSRDPRIKFIELGFSHALVMEFAAKLRCKILYIKANKGLLFEKPEFKEEFFNVVKNSAGYFERHFVDGLHHVHLDNPEIVAPLITEFLKNCPGDTLQMKRMPENDPNGAPSYTYEQIVDHLYKAIQHWASREACEILLKRGSVKLTDGRYAFRRDPRLKAFADVGFTHDFDMLLATKVRCNMLIILANQGFIYETPEIREKFLNIVRIQLHIMNIIE
ncbi:hypothetical protein L9F63_016525, partial [Diploptera punctata]